MMTVAELIAKLSEMNQNLEVCFSETYGQTWPIRDLVPEYLTNLETDEEQEYLILTEQVLA